MSGPREGSKRQREVFAAEARRHGGSAKFAIAFKDVNEARMRAKNAAHFAMRIAGAKRNGPYSSAVLKVGRKSSWTPLGQTPEHKKWFASGVKQANPPTRRERFGTAESRQRSAEWDESLHPRDAAGKFENK